MGYRNERGPAFEGFRPLAEEKAVLADLNEFAFEPTVPSLEALKGLFLMTPEQLAGFVAGEPVITDDMPYTEFPLWRSWGKEFGSPITLQGK
jgi:hypothetical protein